MIELLKSHTLHEGELTDLKHLAYLVVDIFSAIFLFAFGQLCKYGPFFNLTSLLRCSLTSVQYHFIPTTANGHFVKCLEIENMTRYLWWLACWCLARFQPSSSLTRQRKALKAGWANTFFISFVSVRIRPISVKSCVVYTNKSEELTASFQMKMSFLKWQWLHSKERSEI